MVTFEEFMAKRNSGVGYQTPPSSSFTTAYNAASDFDGFMAKRPQKTSLAPGVERQKQQAIKNVPKAFSMSQRSFYNHIGGRYDTTEMQQVKDNSDAEINDKNAAYWLNYYWNEAENLTALYDEIGNDNFRSGRLTDYYTKSYDALDNLNKKLSAYYGGRTSDAEKAIAQELNRVRESAQAVRDEAASYKTIFSDTVVENKIKEWTKKKDELREKLVQINEKGKIRVGNEGSPRGYFVYPPETQQQRKELAEEIKKIEDIIAILEKINSMDEATYHTKTEYQAYLKGTTAQDSSDISINREKLSPSQQAFYNNIGGRYDTAEMQYDAVKSDYEHEMDRLQAIRQETPENGESYLAALNESEWLHQGHVTKLYTNFSQMTEDERQEEIDQVKGEIDKIQQSSDEYHMDNQWKLSELEERLRIYETVISDEKEAANKEQYESIVRHDPNFTSNSRYDSALGEETNSFDNSMRHYNYRYLNDKEFRKSNVDYVMNDRWWLNNSLKMITNEELAVYNALMKDEEGGEYVAEQYLKSLNLKKRLNDKLINDYSEWACSGVLEGTAASFLSIINTIAVSPAAAIQNVVAGTIGGGIDPYSALNFSSNLLSAGRVAVAEKLEENCGGFMKTAYNAFMSALDIGVAILITKGVGAAVGAVGVSTDTISSITSTVLSLSSAQSVIMDFKERGATDAEALLGGVAAGAFEYIFEKISLGEILKATNYHTAKDIFLNAIRSSASEGSEEMLTEIANNMADWWIMGGRSNYESTYQAYLNQGYTAEEATAKATAETAMQVFEAGYTGALAGGAMSVASSVAGKLRNSKKTVSNMADVDKKLRSLNLNEEQRQMVFSLIEKADNAYYNGESVVDAVGKEFDDVVHMINEAAAKINSSDMSASAKYASQNGIESQINTLLDNLDGLPSRNKTVGNQSMAAAETGVGLPSAQTPSGNLGISKTATVGQDTFTQNTASGFEGNINPVMIQEAGSLVEKALASTGETIEQLGYARMGKLASDAIEALPNSSLKTLLQQQLKGRFREDFFRRAKSGIPVRQAFFDTLYDHVPQTKTASNEYVASLLPETGAQNTQQDTAKLSENSDNIPPEMPAEGLQSAETADIIESNRDADAEDLDSSKPFVDDPYDENGHLKPNVTYQAGEYEYYYETDDKGRICKWIAKALHLTERTDRIKNYHRNTPGKADGDHAGHLIADMFGGSPGLNNLVSQLRRVNLSDYRKLENEWKRALEKKQNVKVFGKILYEGDSARPTGFQVVYFINGDKFVANIPNLKE